ncbi:MAG: hypothetical protein K0R88_586 [Solirubrobacterales bacterium]|jgi:uncharacterized protein (DUF2236 family)|nr:hypothetical protein [Solirubrobacterales bacterium]MDF2758472.1 hypothetical protein [Thermomicrobiales bacterium]
METARLISMVPGLPRSTRDPRAADVDGLFTADSMLRRLHRERIVALSGIRALLMQACDPLAVVGFRRHSVVFDEPRTRLMRTDEWMSRIYFGTSEEAERTGAAIRAMHSRVRGRTAEVYGPIPEGVPYDASDPELALWVLATLADSALVYFERVFGRLSRGERDSYWSDYRRVGELLGLPRDSMPATEAELREYVGGRLHDGSLSISDEQRDLAVAIVLEPPFTGWLRTAVTPVTETVKLISTGLLPAEVRTLLGFPWDPPREALLQSAMLQLRAGIRLWPDAIRLHPAARTVAGERYGALAA